MRRRYFFGWTGVAVTCGVLTAGIRSAPGAWLLPVQGDLGWSMGTLSFAAALGLVGLGGPLSGDLMRRLGVRTLTLLSLLLRAIRMVFSRFIQRAWPLDGFRSALGAGDRFGSERAGANVANRWFVRRRGLVLGVFGAAT